MLFWPQDNVYVPCNSLEEAVLCLLLTTQDRTKVKRSQKMHVAVNMNGCNQKSYLKAHVKDDVCSALSVSQTPCICLGQTHVSLILLKACFTIPVTTSRPTCCHLLDACFALMAKHVHEQSNCILGKTR